MTTSYPILNHSRTCATTGRLLVAGEKYCSALFDESGQFVRKDYSAAAWPGPPENALAFWTGTVPDQHQKRRLTFDPELLMECFVRLAEDADPGKVQFRYVVALLLLRRKQLRFDDVRRESGQEFLRLTCSRTGAAFEVLDPHLSEADVARVQEEVVKVLGWE
jgi:hypothetical protein